TAPLLCSAAGNWFEPERPHQVERRRTQRQPVDRGPEVDDVPLLAALFVEALEDVGLEVDAEGPAPGVAAMQRTGTASLRTAATQPRRQTQLVEYPRQRQLPLEVGEIDRGALAGRLGFATRAGEAPGATDRARGPSRVWPPGVPFS